MIIKMDQTRRGAENGFDVIRFHKDVVYYEVPQSLASSFIREGSAHEASLQEMQEQIDRAREAV